MNRILTARAASVALAACLTGALATSSQAVAPAQRTAAESPAAPAVAHRAPSADATAPFRGAQSGPRGKVTDYVPFIKGSWWLAKGLANCGTASGCMTSSELSKLYEMDAKLDQMSKDLKNLQASIDRLSLEVKQGFSQLNIRISQFQYAEAEAKALARLDNASQAMLNLSQALDPKRSAALRTQSYEAFVREAQVLDGEVLAALTSVAGAGDATSRMGVLPAAWDMLLTKERARQGIADQSALPPYLPWRVVNQMNAIGEMWITREAVMGVVISTYRAQGLSSEGDQQAASAEVAELFRIGDGSAQYRLAGLNAQAASLPKELPTLTGVLTGGRRADGKGLVVGNFSPQRKSTEARPLVNGKSGWSVRAYGEGIRIDRDGVDIRFGAPKNCIDCGLNPRKLWYDNGLYGGPACLTVTSLSVGGYIDSNTCDKGRDVQAWVINGPYISPVSSPVDSAGSPTLCLTVRDDKYPPNWAQSGGPIVDLETCRSAGDRQKWFFWGPTPYKRPTPADLNGANTLGSPMGDNPDDTATPWSTQWQLIKANWVTAIYQSVVGAGTTLKALSDLYGEPGVDPMDRVLPPWLDNPSWDKVPAWNFNVAPDGACSPVWGRVNESGEYTFHCRLDLWDAAADIVAVPITVKTYLYDKSKGVKSSRR